MPRILLPVDGSEAATRATSTLVAMLDWYKERPQIDLLAVHAPVPKLPNMSVVVTDDMIQRYYDEECAAMLQPSRAVLDAAGVGYTMHVRVGPIAETIVSHATKSQCDIICMGTRGMTALANMALGSVATRVLHLAHVPVLLMH